MPILANIQNRVQEQSNREILIGAFHKCSHLLKSGSVIIGENHGSVYARALVLDLFRADLVRVFFIELPNMDLSEYSNLPNLTFNEYFATIRGPLYSHDQHWHAVKSLLKMSFMTIRNQIATHSLIGDALSRDIDVIFYEDPNLCTLVTEQGVSSRNEYAASIFNAHIRDNSECRRDHKMPFALVLCGGSHTKSNSLRRERPTNVPLEWEFTIQNQIGVDLSRVINLQDLAAQP